MLEKLREKARKLPEKPGVYIMHGEDGSVIYVGKAKILKNRVSSYFVGAHNLKTETLVSQIADFEVVVVNSEFEALVLENQLIKHHMPKYNILLKDDKGYPFVRLDVKSEYPRFTLAQRMENDGAEYFGPFGGRNMTRAAIEAVCMALKLPTCRRRFPQDIGKERPCLNYHMGTCSGYCLKDVSAEEYRAAMDDAVMVFSGRTDKLVTRLREEMECAAEDLKFELAAEKRDRIKALSALGTKQHVLSQAKSDADAVGWHAGETKSCFVVLHYVGGQLLDKDFQLLGTQAETDEEALSSLVRQYYLGRGSAPKEILLPAALPDAQALEQLISETVGHRVKLLTPQRGDKLVLVKTAALNAQEEILRSTTREERLSKTAEWLKKALGLPEVPKRIEAFDISNTGNDDIVASMVVFVSGKPRKRDYRRFKITSTDGQNDYGSMEEAVFRRLKSFADGDPKFSELPDLMLIDGGAAHVGAAQKAALRAGVDVRIYGMVKDDRHRTHALVSPGGREIGIKAQPGVFSFIGTIQEETHRFAIEYHRKLRSGRMKKSVLDGIEGVGDKRKEALLKTFKSVKAISEAGVDELSKVVPRNVAETVYKHFDRESGEV